MLQQTIQTYPVKSSTPIIVWSESYLMLFENLLKSTDTRWYTIYNYDSRRDFWEISEHSQDCRISCCHAEYDTKFLYNLLSIAVKLLFTLQ